MDFTTLKTLTILYVEDELDLQGEIYENISPFVKKMIKASNGLEGLELYKQHTSAIDVIITDILMPQMNGIDMIDEIRKINQDIPVIYATAFNDVEYMKRTIEQSVTGYITKPIDIELMLQTIQKASLKVENDRLKESLVSMNKNLEALVEQKTEELKLQNKKLYKQVYTDRLTTLPNRASWLKDIKSYENPVLVIVDVDRFKTVNDLYGEAVGNIVLVAISRVLKDFVKYMDCNLYRIGSDQFALLREHEGDMQRCKSVITNLIATVNSKYFHIDEFDIDISVNVTVGVSNRKTHIMETADMALKKAKNDRIPYLIYEDDFNLDKEYKNDIKWTKIIKDAITSKNVVVYYQPIVDESEKLVKYEALIRIEAKDEVYSPFFFLDIAKKVKFYSKLETIMIKKAFEIAHKNKVHVSVNLSIEDIMNTEFIEYIKKLMLKYSISKFITFELLESESITDYEKVVNFIENMKKLGCQIAIDDFGSGYSNFAYLVKFQPDFIKIDGSLVKNIDTDNNSYLITKTINDFAHQLGIKTVAEYVHSETVFEKLKEIGIDLFQGYYFREPKPL